MALKIHVLIYVFCLSMWCFRSLQVMLWMHLTGTATGFAHFNFCGNGHADDMS